MSKESQQKLSRGLFYSLVFLLPLNLGYHFVLRESFLHGLLIDYLIPTLYVQDILSVVLLILNYRYLLKKVKQLDKYLIWFLMAVVLSVLSAELRIISAIHFARLLVYILSLRSAEESLKKDDVQENVIGIASIWMALLSVMAFFQWTQQGSVFDDYLFFGEQPYSTATPGINIENFFGAAKVPPYGTFRHPNIFGGILSVLLIWLLFYIKKSDWYKLVFVLGVMTLWLTLSKFSWLSFLLGLSLFFMFKVGKRRMFSLGLGITGLVMVVSLLLPFLPNTFKLEEKPSYYQRSHLLYAAYDLISEQPLFGVGYGTATAFIDKHLPPQHDIRLAQPPHNIFVLLLVESGVFSLLFFAVYIFKKTKQSFKKPVLFIAMVQMMFLGLFDHYFFTIHQPQLLFWMIIGLI